VLIREHSVDHFFRFYFNRYAAFPGGFDRCHLPSKEQKEALLREVRKTDPEYSLAKLIHWFSNRRRLYHESKKEQKDGKEDVLSTLLDPTTSLARESRPSIILRYTSWLTVPPSVAIAFCGHTASSTRHVTRTATPNSSAQRFIGEAFWCRKKTRRQLSQLAPRMLAQ
jgi:hypothetical protein